MKTLILITVFFFLTFNLKAQHYSYTIDSSLINCDLSFKLNCELPNNAESYDFFCDAVKKAAKDNNLSLMTLGDPGHIPGCVYHSYKYWGVKLMPLGDIVDLNMEATMEGHNCIMKEKIKKHLGEKYDSLGLLPPNIKNIDSEIIDTLFKSIEVKLLNQDSFFINANLEMFDFLDEAAIFVDYLSKSKFNLGELKKGLILPLGTKRSTYYLNVLNLKIGNFDRDKYWCGSKTWSLPIKIKVD